MKHFWGSAAVAALMGMTLPALAPAYADVKTGVDAWQQGDYAKAISEWRPLAQTGDPDAQFNLGQAYKLGRGVPADLPTAIDWYRKATQQGHTRAEDNLGLLMFQQGDRSGALPYLQHASMRGEPRAQYIVATTLFNGDLIGKDWVRAYALMTRASASGLPQATESLTQMDKFIPEDQRKQGLAMAANLEKSEKNSTTLAAASPAPTTRAPVRPSPSAVRTTELPASTIKQPALTPVSSPKAAPQQVAAAKPQPAPKPAPKATPAAATIPAPAASGGWRVQLGAFGEEGRARGLWSQLTGKVSGLSAYQPYLVKAGTITRLQAGPIASSADATRLCSRIKAAGADCMPKKL